MKVEIINYQEDEFDTIQGFAVKIDGEEKFNFWSDPYSPEDNNMNRNFSGVIDIPEVINMAFEHGKKHPEEQIEFVNYFTTSTDAFDALVCGYEVPEDVADSVQNKAF